MRTLKSPTYRHRRRPIRKNGFVRGALERHRLPLGVGVETIRGVGIAGLVIGPIQPLRCRDVVHHWRGWIRRLKVVAGLVFLRPVAHDAARLGIPGIDRATVVGRAATIVVAWMLQADGVPDFMYRGHRKVAAQARSAPCFQRAYRRGRAGVGACR